MVLLKARHFASEITHTQLKQEGLCSEAAIAREQVKNSRDVYKLLMDRGIVPQALPRARKLFATRRPLSTASDWCQSLRLSRR